MELSASVHHSLSARESIYLHVELPNEFALKIYVTVLLTYSFSIGVARPFRT